MVLVDIMALSLLLSVSDIAVLLELFTVLPNDVPNGFIEFLFDELLFVPKEEPNGVLLFDVDELCMPNGFDDVEALPFAKGDVGVTLLLFPKVAAVVFPNDEVGLFVFPKGVEDVFILVLLPFISMEVDILKLFGANEELEFPNGESLLELMLLLLLLFVFPNGRLLLDVASDFIPNGLLDVNVLFEEVGMAALVPL